MSNNTQQSTRENLEIVILALKEIISIHEEMRKSFRKPLPFFEFQKKFYENSHTICLYFIFWEQNISLQCLTRCAKSIILYKPKFFIDNKKITIKEVRELLKEFKTLLASNKDLKELIIFSRERTYYTNSLNKTTNIIKSL